MFVNTEKISLKLSRLGLEVNGATPWALMNTHAHTHTHNPPMATLQGQMCRPDISPTSYSLATRI